MAAAARYSVTSTPSPLTRCFASSVDAPAAFARPTWFVTSLLRLVEGTAGQNSWWISRLS